MHAKKFGDFGDGVGTASIRLLNRQVTIRVLLRDRLQGYCRTFRSNHFAAHLLAVNAFQHAFDEGLAAEY